LHKNLLQTHCCPLQWADKLASKKGELTRIYKDFQTNVSPNPSVNISSVLAARVDLPIEEKSSSSSVRANTKSAVHSVSIGRVPDRGGRPDEVQPPPVEMPSWQQRQTSSRGGRGGGGRGRGGGQSGWIQNPAMVQSQQPYQNQQRGGRVQGNWAGGDRGSQQGYSRPQDNYQARSSSSSYREDGYSRDHQQSYNHYNQNQQYEQQQQGYGNNFQTNDYGYNKRGRGDTRRSGGARGYGHHSGGRNYY